MSHQIESIAYRVEVPWHGLGVKSDHAMSLAECLDLGEMNWQVNLCPSLAEVKLPNGTTTTIRVMDSYTIPEPVPGLKKPAPQPKPLYQLVRMDKLRAFGQVTGAYKIVQNNEVGEFVHAITGNYDAKFETAGVLDEGRKVWFLNILDEDINIAGDKIQPYFLIVNSHDGKGSLICRTTPVRVVCANTLAMALKGIGREFKIRHMGDMETRLGEAAKTMNFTKKYYENFAQFANKLAAQKVSQAQVETLVQDVLFPLPEDPTKRGETVIKRAREIILECLKKPDLANIKNTAWGVLNAVGDYSDHYRIIKGSVSDNRTALETGFVRSFADNDLKDAALSFLASIK